MNTLRYIVHRLTHAHPAHCVWCRLEALAR